MEFPEYVLQDAALFPLKGHQGHQGCHWLHNLAFVPAPSDYSSCVHILLPALIFPSVVHVKASLLTPSALVAFHKPLDVLSLGVYDRPPVVVGIALFLHPSVSGASGFCGVVCVVTALLTFPWV